jgi:hypothetical protein
MAIRKILKGQDGLFSRSGMDEGHHNLRVAVSFILHVSASLIPQLMRLDCRLRMPAASNSTVAIHRAC